METEEGEKETWLQGSPLVPWHCHGASSSTDSHGLQAGPHCLLAPSCLCTMFPPVSSGLHERVRHMQRSSALNAPGGTWGQADLQPIPSGTGHSHCGQPPPSAPAPQSTCSLFHLCREAEHLGSIALGCRTLRPAVQGNEAFRDVCDFYCKSNPSFSMEPPKICPELVREYTALTRPGTENVDTVHTNL